MSGRSKHVTEKNAIADALNRIYFRMPRRISNRQLKIVGERAVTVAPHSIVVVEMQMLDRGQLSPEKQEQRIDNYEWGRD